MGGDLDAWCKYHRMKGHTTDDCIHSKNEIEKLIQNGRLRGFVRDQPEGSKRHSNEPEKSERKKGDDEGPPDKRHTLNTITSAFAGGGESSSSRKKYVRQVMFLVDTPDATQKDEPEITFTSREKERVLPLADDPMVITLHMFNWNVKRVCVDLVTPYFY
jgi:hypothetical protein